MAEPATRPRNAAAFCACQLGQGRLDARVDGVPVPQIKMTTGASTQHDQVTVNIVVSPSLPLEATAAVRLPTDIAPRRGIAMLRSPHITVGCGERIRDLSEIRAPRLVDGGDLRSADRRHRSARDGCPARAIRHL